MEIKILQLIEGARQARGLAVIIDVLRAFSVECYMSAAGARRIIAVGDIDEARRLKEEMPDALLVGERGGKMCEGFDCGNSPSQLARLELVGRDVIHTTSAGTQGIANAVNADEIISGSLVNARSVAEYIRMRAPEEVSLVCMGNNAVREAEEDTLCAEYIRALLLGEEFDLAAKISALRTGGGKHFFVPGTQDVFPEQDFWMCTDADKFGFVLCAQERDGSTEMVRKDILTKK